MSKFSKIFKGTRGKQILVTGLAVLVIVAGYYRWNVEGDVESTPVMSESVENAENDNQAADLDYFAKARYERDCARSEAAELLKVSNMDDEIALEKNRKMLETYAKSMEKETAIENMVIAKGYQDCVAFVDETGARVIVKTDSLKAESVAQIKDIVVEKTGLDPTEIKISTKE